MKTALVIGAGATGIAAAYELSKRENVRVVLVEAEPRVGGIAAAERSGNDYIDVGGHRFFSKKPELAALFRELGESEEQLLIRHRYQSIFYRRKFLHYPITLNPALVKELGFGTVAFMGMSWLRALCFPKPETTLENFYINRFGKRLYRMFFESYTEKVCGASPAEISPEWGKDRVRGLSVKAILHLEKKTEASGAMPADEFLYPRLGPGQLWESAAKRLEEKGVEILLNTEVTAIERAEDGSIQKVKLRNEGGEAELKPDYCISTIPVRELISLFKGVPPELSELAAGLKSRGFLSAVIKVPRSQVLCRQTDCWVYVQEADVSVGRFQIYNNWSPDMVENGEEELLLGFEYFADPGDELWELSETELCSLAVREAKQVGILAGNAEPKLLRRCAIQNAYPFYGGSYSRRGEVFDWLDGVGGLACAGRQGLHSYLNMDAAMESGILAAQAMPE